MNTEYMSKFTKPFDNVEQAFQTLTDLGCDFCLVKRLSQSQDNDKNQVYLGGSSVVFQRLPGSDLKVEASRSKKSRMARNTSLKIAQSLSFYWVDQEGHYKAPRTKLIFYPQYPEIRLSGFLTGSFKSPLAIRRTHQGEFGKRYLLLGIAGQQIYSVVLTDLETNNCFILDSLPLWAASKILRLKVLTPKSASLDGSVLIDEIKAIASAGPHLSVTLDALGEKPRPFSGWQGGGYTLEALLGIPRNGISAPDKYGYEIKTFNKSSITLITTEPDFGWRQTEGLSSFLKEFGWRGAKDDGSLRFNGRHYLEGKSSKKSKLRLTIIHWDIESNSPTGTGDPVICLTDGRNRVAAGWTLKKLTDAWMKKHSGAVYVEVKPLKTNSERYPNSYDFKGRLYRCEGTSTVRLIQALLDGVVFLDPGDRELADGNTKKRTQWRLTGDNRNLAKLLEKLYDNVSDESG